VKLDRLIGDAESGRDRFVLQARGHELEDFNLARRQRFDVGCIVEWPRRGRGGGHQKCIGRDIRVARFRERTEFAHHVGSGRLELLPQIAPLTRRADDYEPHSKASP